MKICSHIHKVKELKTIWNPSYRQESLPSRIRRSVHHCGSQKCSSRVCLIVVRQYEGCVAKPLYREPQDQDLPSPHRTKFRRYLHLLVPATWSQALEAKDAKCYKGYHFDNYLPSMLTCLTELFLSQGQRRFQRLSEIWDLHSRCPRWCQVAVWLLLLQPESVMAFLNMGHLSKMHLWRFLFASD